MTTLLSSADLALLRTCAERALTTTVTIQRRTVVQDALGGQTETWATLSTPKALIQTEPGDEAPQAAKLSGTFSYRVRLPSGTDVKIEDRLVADGRTLEVVGVAVPKTHEVLRSLRAVEVR